MARSLLLAAAAGIAAAWFAREGAAPASERLGGLDISSDRLMAWRAGIPGGIPEVPVRVDVTRFGARGDGKTDDSAAIQAALAAVQAPGAVLIPEGTYLLKKPVRLRSGVVLRGAGPEKTHLRFEIEKPALFGGAIEIYGRDAPLHDVGVGLGFYKPEQVAIPEDRVVLPSGAMDAGTDSVVVEPGKELKKGQFVAVFCDNDPPLIYGKDFRWQETAGWAHHCVGQILRIKDVAGNQVSFDRPIRLAYKKEFRPRLLPIEMIERAGVEDLHVWRTHDALTFMIDICYATECWVKNCHSAWATRCHVYVRKSRDLVIRDNVIHHAYEYGGGGHGYGIDLEKWTTDCLVENNILDHLRHHLSLEQGPNGNVFGYNMLQRCLHTYDISVHGHWPYMNLFEGNVVQSIGCSDWHGPAGPFNTFFRNRIEKETVLQHAMGGGASSLINMSHHTNVIANTFKRGHIAIPNEFKNEDWYEKNYLIEIKKDAFINGYAFWDWQKETSPHVKERYVSPKAVTIPASLYLKAKPPFWGNRPWPGIGADSDFESVRTGKKEFSPTPAEERYQKIKDMLK